jgi:hypothetical protein
MVGRTYSIHEANEALRAIETREFTKVLISPQ